MSEQEGLARMSAAMHHRGPDDEGIYLNPDKRCGLVHRRLAIIDPTPEAHQPMTAPNGDALIFNGEIYNYNELRAKYGLRVPESDTAVLFSLLQQKGEDILPELRGFFTFVYWNERDHTLLIARDALGKKPLYYALSGQRLLFASEERTLIASGYIRSDISREAFAKYLTYYSVPNPNSIIHPVLALGPGTRLLVKPKGVSVINRWYHLPKHEPIAIEYQDAVSEVRRLLEESVKYRLVSDVPVGAFLSGGLDSNAIVGLMSRQVSNPIETFSIGFDNRLVGGPRATKTPQSETVWARIGAKAFGTQHHECILTGEDVAASLPGFFASMDSPTGDGLNSFLVSKFARESNPDLKVVLTGVGADEYFLGYRKMRWLAQHAGLLRAIHLLPRDMRKGFAERIRRISTNRKSTAIATILDPFRIRHLFDQVEVERLTGLSPHLTPPSQIEASELMDILRQDIDGYLPDMLLRDIDQFTMSQSLEARAPLLDIPLMEFVWQLPLTMKSRGATKQLLADAVADILPQQLKDKPKTGFELPIKEGLLHGALKPYLDILTSDEMLLVKEGLLKKDAVRSVHSNFIRGESHYLKPWSLIAIECWYRAQKGVGGGV